MAYQEQRGPSAASMWKDSWIRPWAVLRVLRAIRLAKLEATATATDFAVLFAERLEKIGDRYLDLQMTMSAGLVAWLPPSAQQSGPCAETAARSAAASSAADPLAAERSACWLQPLQKLNDLVEMHATSLSASPQRGLCSLHAEMDTSSSLVLKGGPAAPPAESRARCFQSSFGSGFLS